MNYVYVMTAPHRLSKTQEMKFTRHVFGCPETQYGLEFEPTQSDLDGEPITDCTCVTGAAGSPVVAAEAGDTPAATAPLALVESQDEPPGGQDDSPSGGHEPWRTGLLSWHGTFEFMVNMRKRANDPSWTPTPKQLAAIEKCLLREGNPPQKEESVAEGIHLDPLGDWRYAVEQPDGTYYALVLSTGTGKWDGWRFVMGKQLPGGEIERLGRQKPHETYSGGHQRDLVTLLTDPEVGLNQYFEQTGICSVCFTRHDGPLCLD